MNTKSWAELLKHFLYLFIFIDLASGIVLIVTSKSCISIFKENEIVPIGLKIRHRSLEISVDVMFSLVSSYGFVFIVVGFFGLFGVCSLEKWDTINFTFGILILKSAVIEFVSANSLTSLLNSYDDIIEGSMVELFKSTNTFNVSKHIAEDDDSNPLSTKKIRKNSPYKIYNLPFNERGWSLASEGGFRNQTYVDFIQLNLKCCGLTGRNYWDMRIPRSCCPKQHIGENCVVSVANSKSCLHDYHTFRDCGATLRAEFICFGIIALLSAMDSLYLAYLRIQFPDGDYKSDKSSDDDEEMNYI